MEISHHGQEHEPMQENPPPRAASQLQPERLRPIVTFEERFEQFYLQLADGKTGGMVACVQEMQEIVDSARGNSERTTTTPTGSTNPGLNLLLYQEMLQDCRRKAGEATLDHLRRLCQRRGGGVKGDEAMEVMGEEEALIVSYHAALLGRAEAAANIYGGFLKNRFKQANDAAIKKLSSLRALHRLNVASSWGCAVRARQPGSWGDDKSSPNDSPEEVGVAGASAAEDPHPHITALATVFGEASKLMARLAESNLGQNVEEPVARLVHEESKAQAVKVLEWFQHDTDLPKWQVQASGSAGGDGGAGRRASNSSSRSPTSSASTSGIGFGLSRYGTNSATSVAVGGKNANGGSAVGETGSGVIAFDARGMDFVIDEMALACQYCQRYLDFVVESVGLSEEPSSEFFAQVRLVEGAYVQLEDAYCLRSIEEAMRIAEPIEISMPSKNL